MRRTTSIAFVLAVAMAAWGCAQPAPPAPPPPPAAPVADAPEDIQALNAAREAFMKGYEAGDADAIGALYMEEAISEPNNQPTLKGRAAIVASLKAMFAQVSVKPVLTPDETRTLGSVGLDRGTYIVTVTPKSGAPATSSEGRYMVVFVKGADGTWKVSRDIDNAAGAPAPEPAAAPAAK